VPIPQDLFAQLDFTFVPWIYSFSIFPVHVIKKPVTYRNRFAIFILMLICYLPYRLLFAERPNMSETRNNTMKMKNKILAMEAAPAATPPNPKMAAIIATIRNITDQRSIKNSFRFKKIDYCLIAAFILDMILKISCRNRSCLKINALKINLGNFFFKTEI